ncbi:SDR family NAD(P)-dependent oxidoreductase [Streptomyces sp. NPDC059850]|uniref:SDR family NAD(P)-dependent oxidoreductase n=1 Tax=Streptomyces sp. NPDC059850 TaxID=3346970 RepID=UPI0036487E79
MAARGRLMQALPPGGAMVAVAAAVDEVAGLLGEGVEIAAVNGPSSVVLSGERDAVVMAADWLRERGGKTKRLAVSHAFHSRRMEPMLADFAAALTEVVWHPPVIPVVSNVTGRVAEPGELADPRYWVEHVRRPVRFAEGIAAAVEDGGTLFVELGPGAVLTGMVEETATAAAAGVVCVAALRDGRPEGKTLLASVAELFVRGIAVDWSGVVPLLPTGRVDLPTYAFDHQHYWLQSAESATDAASLGQSVTDHPLLGAMVPLPQSDGLVFTSRLSLRSHPWLADHAIGGVVLFPGTGLVELAVRAGDEAGCPVLDELVTESPLVVPEHGGVRMQVAVGGPAENGSRTVEVYSQREDGAEAWTRHATGVLSAARSGSGAGFDFTAWPPQGAQQVEVGDFYADLVERGYAYGPAFQGLRTVWRRGEEVFAEVALPDEHREDAAGFGIHPALLDAALHAGMLGAAADTEDSEQPVLPFAWNGLVLHAAGASALRVRLEPGGPGEVSLEAADETGGLVATLGSLVSRPVSAEQLEPAPDAARDSLFRVEWTELPQEQGESSPPWMAVTTAHDVLALTGSPDLPAVVVEAAGGEDALAVTSRVLGVVQAWLAGAEESRLVVVTRGAVPAGDGAVTDPAAAAVWGLVRAAQAENPDRIILLDLDPATEDGPEAVLGSVLASGEPQVAVRGSTLSVPRLTRAAGEVPDAPAMFDPEGTVLVTGGTGSLGALVARHLVTRHGVRHLVLASRRGRDAEGAAELVAELTEQGAQVSVAACDVSDRDQVADLLEEHRPTGVVHTAGAFDAGVIGALTPERLATVFAPKVDAVRHLDELTRGMDLDAFIVYSSVSSVFMGAGSSGYAAANAFLDGLMAHRRAAGLPGLSLAWGTWHHATNLTTHLSDVDQARMSRRASRDGVVALTPAEGTDLFDAAVGSGHSLLVPVKLDLRGVRAGAAMGGVPHLLRGLVRAGRQQARAASAEDGGLVRRLAGLVAGEQEALLLNLVRGQVAVVLGHSEVGAVRADVAFKDAGFDSLTSVELRNRLRAETGLKLPATLAFDHPTPLVLARYLRDELAVDDNALARLNAKIEDIESLISGPGLDESMKSGIALRLQGLVARCNGVLEQADTTTVADQLESASADEVLNFIDSELGRI